MGKLTLVITNLKPHKFRGIESQGMFLAAEKGEQLTLLTGLEDIDDGASVN